MVLKLSVMVIRKYRACCPGPTRVGSRPRLLAGRTCVDTGVDPKETGEPQDTVPDCDDSSVAWGVVDPGGTDMGKLNAGFDNVVLLLSTDATGAIVAANAYYTMEYPIINPFDNSWVGRHAELHRSSVTAVRRSRRPVQCH